MFSKYKIIEMDTARHPEVSAFIKHNHYSGSLSRGNKHVFLLLVKGHLRGVATFGVPTGKSCQKLYSTGSGDVMECKRFVLAPNAPKNTASWFMAKCLKQLKLKANIEVILSYADPEAGHEGIMYKASNFQYLGRQSKKGQAIKILGQAKPVHLRMAYQKINGVYTKTAKYTQGLLKTGKAKYITLEAKHIYCYNLKKRG